MEVIYNSELAYDATNGTYKVGSLVGVSYWDLKYALGSPTFVEASGDDKIQKEWVINYNGETFTIYDWKTFDEEYTVCELKLWSIGGKTDPYEFEAAVLKEIEKSREAAPF